jgi:nucleoside-diphosphate-sugar epimerase
MLDPATSLLLVTGATGLVGSHVAERARKEGIRTRALVRMHSDIRLLQRWGVELVTGSITEPYSVQGAMRDVTHVVHCAAKLGDWGPVDPYRDVNVKGFDYLLDAATRSETLRRLIHISSMAVYAPRDHFGDDETEPLNKTGADAYALTKVEAEELLNDYVRREKVPAVALRPGWIYGPRDRVVMPRIIDRLRDGKFAFLGTGEQLMNNVYVGNLVHAIWLALEKDEAVGQAFNVADGRLVTKHEFFGTIAELAGLPKPTRHIPLGVARPLTYALEGLWKLLGVDQPPLLSRARLKLLGLNLDYSIAKARRLLGYDPQVDFQEGMQVTMEWFNRHRA